LGRLQGPLILASASPQRRKILKKLGIPFEIVPSRVSERSSEKDPRRLVVQLARRKALSVAKRRPGAVVLGSDTLVVCKGEILGKPKNRKDSERILRLLNGAWQRVYTGVAVVAGKRVYTDCAVSKVLARKLSDEQLLKFAGKHMDKAGAYAVQDKQDPFIARVVGDLDNVIGLPLRSVRKTLRRAAGPARRRAA
jgi:septum formation protein